MIRYFSLAKTDNLLRVYSIFSSDTVDAEVKQNAGKQLAVMLSTGDAHLHKTFIGLDGVAYCVSLLSNSKKSNNTTSSSSSSSSFYHSFLMEMEVDFPLFSSFSFSYRNLLI